MVRLLNCASTLTATVFVAYTYVLLCAVCRHGDSIPRIDYTQDELNTWKLVWDKVRVTRRIPSNDTNYTYSYLYMYIHICYNNYFYV
jgi:Biopterin-dependent aromatic amino acid hydroxylase